MSSVSKIYAIIYFMYAFFGLIKGNVIHDFEFPVESYM
jgi:hypothetical protein